MRALIESTRIFDGGMSFQESRARGDLSTRINQGSHLKSSRQEDGEDDGNQERAAGYEDERTHQIDENVRGQQSPVPKISALGGKYQEDSTKDLISDNLRRKSAV